MVTRAVQITPKATQIASFLQKNAATVYLVNTDLANTFYMGEDPSNLPIPVQPLGQIELIPGQNVYAATLANGVSVNALLTSGQWTPSAAQVAIATANLAKDTTVQTVATNTTGAAKDSSVTPLAKETGGNLAATVAQLIAGVAPAVPNYQVASLQGVTPTSGVTIINPGVAFRVWACSVTSTWIQNGTVTAAATGYAGIFDTTNLFYINLIQNGLGLFTSGNTSGGNQNSITQTFALNGMSFPAGDSLKLDVNAGATHTNVVQQTSCVVYYSTP